MRMDSGSCLDHNNLDLQNLLEVQAPHPAPADCPQPRAWDLAATNRLVLVQDGVFPPLQPESLGEASTASLGQALGRLLWTMKKPMVAPETRADARPPWGNSRMTTAQEGTHSTDKRLWLLGSCLAKGGPFQDF